MPIESHIQLFRNGTDFEQIQFLDNFYYSVNIESEKAAELLSLLLNAINNSTNVFIKRSAFKILCQLTLSGIIANKFSTLGIIQIFLSGNETILKIIALKYLPYFEQSSDAQMVDLLKELSDDSNGDISSQSFICLGLNQLSKGVTSQDVTEILLTISRAKVYFIASTQSAENRTDADFYSLLCECMEALCVGNLELSGQKFELLEQGLLKRVLYELDEPLLELDFLFFWIVEQIKSSLIHITKSDQWLEIIPNIQALLSIHLELQKIVDSAATSKFLIKKLCTSVFENLENNIYKMNLSSERERLKALNSKTDNKALQNFVLKVLSILPAPGAIESENNELLAMLVECFGNESGLQAYNSIKCKQIAPDVLCSLKTLLRNDDHSQMNIRTGSLIGNEIFASLTSQINTVLPDFPVEKAHIFFNILEEVIRYARVTFVDNDKSRFLFLFAESEGGKGQKAVEQDLQDNMILFFEHSKIADGLGHEQPKFVDGGRVDILYKRDIITIPIELKKTLIQHNQASLESSYIGQSQTYTAGYDQLGIFVLLDLSSKGNGAPPNFRDWFSLHHLTPSSNLPISYPDYIVSVVIPGNRTLPSSKSNYK